MDPADFKPLLLQLVQGTPLTRAQAIDAFQLIMTGQLSDARIGAFLAAIQCRPGGPTVDEIVGGATVMRQHVLRVPTPPNVNVIDTCGTGGVHGVTFNVSTTAAIIAAGAGACVAKHGSVSVTSRSGSSQVLETLGVNLNASVEILAQCLAEARICFCFAIRHHPAMKHVANARRELGFHSIFNLLGPLTNPASAKRQLMGVSSPQLTEKIALVHKELGAQHVMVVHGDNQDDIATTGPTQISTLRNNSVTTTTITPEQFNIPRARIEDLSIESIPHSAQLIRAVLEGVQGPTRDIALLNAAAALVVADLAEDIPQGLTLAAKSVDSGSALHALHTLVKITNS